jgi:hypothetical protein
MKPHCGDESETKAASEPLYGASADLPSLRCIGFKRGIRSGSKQIPGSTRWSYEATLELFLLNERQRHSRVDLSKEPAAPGDLISIQRL